jgi:photosystem II stability/assembly factor-like uncharacterized protein
VPLVVSSHAATRLQHHPASSSIELSFALPLRDKAGLDALIARQAKTHTTTSRAELYARFSPSRAQYAALRHWLVSSGFKVTHVGADRLAISASASTATVEQALHVKINDYVRPGFSYHGLKVKPYSFYANSTAPTVPARLGLQTISGLSDVDRFFTSVQLARGSGLPPIPASCDGACPNVRSGGYFPVDLRGLYDITGHGFDGTGQTVGFTLWTASERQATMTAYATATGDQPITVDPPCIATGNSPTTPSTCTAQTVSPDHLLFVLENGNLDNNFQSNTETGLDIEAAHGIATHVAMKYYAAECSSTTPAGSGLTSAGCNGSDVGLEETVEDAANDPSLHSVSNSWAFGGEAEWGAADPFLQTTEPILALAAAAGTTFYFSTGDSGTYESGYPSDSPYVVGVGGASTWSTSSSSTYSTTTAWSGGGSWCSNVIARPAWQTGAGVTANAPCPGRVIPDVSAIADPSTGLKTFWTTNATGGFNQGQVGGTSLAAPVMSGLEAVAESFISAQTYPGPTPHIGWVAPLLYQLGNSGHADSYYRDIQCGNTANPTSGPDGDAATKGWDAATGWGEPDWFNYATGIAQLDGATNLSTPASLSQHFSWSCAKTPSNSSERAFSCPTTGTCYAVGAASGGTPWYGKFITSGAWGAVNTFFKSTDGGQSWFPSNSDMFSIACTSGTSCIEVGAGGRERKTSDGGSTWSDVATAPGNNKPLTQVTCPSSSVCYAVGDRGNAMKSTDGGATWTWLNTTDGNPLYGLSCPTTSVCYATDIYAHVMKTADGGATWTWQSTPVTTPGTNVPGSGGPNPFAGLMAISCSDVNTCVASGLYVVVSGQTIPSTDPPIVTTTDGGATWVRQTSNAGSGSYLHAISCLPGTTTCFAVGRGGRIVTTTDLATWTVMTSNTTSMLNSITCLSATFCMASGQGGTIDVYNGSTWTATPGNGGTGFLASVTCVDTTTCYATGKQGVTIATTNGGASWTQQAGGGTTQQMNGVSCPTASTCFAVGNGGTILTTSNGGQTWLAQTSGTTNALNAVSCTSTTACVAVGAAGTARVTTDGSTWNAGTTGTTQALNGVSCSSASQCAAVGALGTALTSSTGGSTWSAGTSGTTVTLTAVSCPSASACYADGAVSAGSAVILKSTDGGSTWAAQASGTPAALNGVACVDASNCIADGTSGTVLATVNGGSSWAQRGNPISGPTTALNATNIALNGATCTSARCLIGLGAQGDILTTPILTVTVTASGAFGTTPNLSGLAPGNAAISYSPPSEAANVTGSLSCSTTATSSSDPGSYPVSSCSGLVDDGFTVVYDYPDSSYTVAKAGQTISFDPIPDHTYGDADVPLNASASSGLTVSYGASGDCSIVAGPAVHITGAGSCTVTASQAGNVDYSAAPDVQQSFDIAKADQTISFDPIADQTFGNPDVPLNASASSGLTVSYGASGNCTIVAGPAVHLTGAGSCTVTASQAGDTNYNAATDVQQSFSIARGSQSIDFPVIPKMPRVHPDFDPGATASSGLAVSYTAKGACTIVSGLVHLTSAGTCKVTASQPGNADWKPAISVLRSFSVLAQAATTTVLSGPTAVGLGASFTLSATISSAGGAPDSGTVQFVNPATSQVIDEVPVSGGVASTTQTAPSTKTTLKVKAVFVPAGGSGYNGSSSKVLRIKIG